MLLEGKVAVVTGSGRGIGRGLAIALAREGASVVVNDVGCAPDLNAPIVAFLASEQAAHVNGQVFGRRGYAFTIFQTPRPIAAMYKEGGWTPAEIAAHFDVAFGEHLQQIGIPNSPTRGAPAK